MSRRALLIAGVLVVLLVACVSVGFVLTTRLAGDTPRRDSVVLTVELPAVGEPLAPSGGGHGPDCPQTQVSSLLGIVIADPHGILVAGVTPRGPAAEGGIMRGDSIVECDGKPVTCRSALLPLLERGEQRRRLELTVLRGAKDSEVRPVSNEDDTT